MFAILANLQQGTLGVNRHFNINLSKVTLLYLAAKATKAKGWPMALTLSCSV